MRDSEVIRDAVIKIADIAYRGSSATSPPFEELLKQMLTVSVGSGLAVVEKAPELIGGVRGRRPAAHMSVEPFLGGRKPLPVRELGIEADLLPFGMSRRLLEL